MADVATRTPLAEARAIADELVEVLALGAERIEVAGSIRRGRPDVGDIEIVAVPHRHTETVRDGLFGTNEVVVDELQVLVDTLILKGTLAPHPVNPARGDRMARLLHVASGLQLDLFSVFEPAQWGVILLIRTGPAAYSQWFVTHARKRGHHVVDGALHVGGMGCVSFGPCETVPVPDEESFYRALGLSFIEPGDRR